MDAVMVVTNAAHAEIAEAAPYELDMSTGYDNRDFEAVFDGVAVEGGSLVYFDGTDLGGVVDSVETATGTTLVVCRGRTWDGIIEGRVIEPPAGSDYLDVSGEANAVLAQLVAMLDLGDIFGVPGVDSGIHVSHRFPRYQEGCTGYVGITDMLAESGARLAVRRLDGVTWLSAVPVSVITDEADSDLMDFSVKKQHRCVNHLVCAGEGEKQERTLIHLYADGSGNVSRTQTFTGVDRIDALYCYTGADADELLAEGTKKLKEYQTSGAVDITSTDSGQWSVGDVLQARDNRTGTVVSVPIRGKLAKVSRETNWTLSVDYEVGSDSATAGVSSSETAEGAGGVIYRAGDGITIAGGTISAEVDAGDLAAVSSAAAGAVSVANAANATAVNHAERADNPHGVTAAQVGLGNVDDTSDADKPVSDATQAALDGKADATHEHDAADVASGTLDAARIPALDASKVASGVLDAARVPGLDASKVASGTLDAARVPGLDAAKIASGTLDSARIPSLDASKVTSGTFAAARIPNHSASKITSGTLGPARLPVATTAARGAVIPDGSTITVAADGTITAQVGASASFLAAHPVGSYFTGPDPSGNGGTWQEMRPMGMPPMWLRTS